MDSRIQQVLDQELSRAELSPEQARELTQVEALISGVLRTLPNEALPDLSPAILDRLGNESNAASPEKHTRPFNALIDWFWRPRPLAITWRPAYALGLVAALVLAIGVRAPVEPTGASPVQPVLVQFRLDAPQARAVTLAGNFTRWKPAYTLTRSEPGIWTVVVPLEPGVHDYAFVVDGERWVADPMAPSVADGFGGVNSRVAVLTPDRPAKL